MNVKRAIFGWMMKNAERFVDECNEVNCTQMVEAWDYETQDGGVTTDPGHLAWEVAVDVAAIIEKRLAS